MADVFEVQRRAGRKGGSARVPKGVAKLPPEKRREIAAAGVRGRLAAAAARKAEVLRHAG